MKTSYAINPRDFRLKRFCELTKSRRMLPGRKMLHEFIDERFRILISAGLNNLEDLLFVLKTKEKIFDFSNRTGIPESYLKLLRREAGSYISKPVNLSEFPGIPVEYVLSLASKGIKHSRHIFEAVQTERELKDLSRQTGIPTDRLVELFNLCDLVRINGIGGVFARIIYETGITSVEQFAESDFHKSYPEYIRINKLRGYSTASFSESDIEFCVLYAKELLNHH